MFLVPNTTRAGAVHRYTPGWRAHQCHLYDNIRVSNDHLVGELHGGWKLITGQLNRERLSLINFGPVSQLFNQVVRWAGRAQLAAGGRVIDEPWVQQNLGDVAP